MKGFELQKKRIYLGLTQAQLARDMCLSKWTIIRWESGENPFPLWAEKYFCLIYGIPFTGSMPAHETKGYAETLDLFPEP
jgi:DNA-binding XRE family transcriptional regulator